MIQTAIIQFFYLVEWKLSQMFPYGLRDVHNCQTKYSFLTKYSKSGAASRTPYIIFPEIKLFQALVWLCDFAGKSERQENTATSWRLGNRGCHTYGARLTLLSKIKNTVNDS